MIFLIINARRSAKRDDNSSISRAVSAWRKLAHVLARCVCMQHEQYVARAVLGWLELLHLFCPSLQDK